MSPEWAPLVAAVDPARFARGQIGPYRVGSSLRATSFGEVVLAISTRFEFIVELDLYDALANTALTAPEGPLMLDLAQASEIEHPNVAKITGAGLEGGVPYVVRRHYLGRTLAQVLDRGGAIPLDAAMSVLFTLAETLGALAKGGPHPGAWSLGGFDASDIYLTYDGRITLVGIGLQRARQGKSDPTVRDLAALIALARSLVTNSEEHAELWRVLARAPSFDAVAKRLRQDSMARNTLARRNEVLGGVLRERFADPIREERAFFGLVPLQ